MSLALESVECFSKFFEKLCEILGKRIGWRGGK